MIQYDDIDSIFLCTTFHVCRSRVTFECMSIILFFPFHSVANRKRRNRYRKKLPVSKDNRIQYTYNTYFVLDNYKTFHNNY